MVVIPESEAMVVIGLRGSQVLPLVGQSASSIPYPGVGRNVRKAYSLWEAITQSNESENHREDSYLG